MQLSFIEFLYISAQPLHKVMITKRNPIEDYAIGACLAQRKVSLGAAWRVLSPKSSLNTTGVRTYYAMICMSVHAK
jgi:hypothetical protein